MTLGAQTAARMAEYVHKWPRREPAARDPHGALPPTWIAYAAIPMSLVTIFAVVYRRGILSMLARTHHSVDAAAFPVTTWAAAGPRARHDV